jgi:hypothetical protein
MLQGIVFELLRGLAYNLAFMKLPEDIREYFRKQGKRGAAIRAATLSPEERTAIAKKAAAVRWSKPENNSEKKQARKRTRGDK